MLDKLLCAHREPSMEIIENLTEEMVLSCPAMRQEEWKGIPSKQEGLSESMGKGEMSTVVKNGSKSNWLEHKVYHEEIADGQKLLG